MGTLCEIFSRQSKIDNDIISITICNCNETSNTVLLVQLLKGTCFRCRRLMAGKGRLHTFQASLQALDYGLISLVNELQDKFNEVTAKGGDDKVRDIQVIEVIDQYLQEATRGNKIISILSHVSLFPKSEVFFMVYPGVKKIQYFCSQEQPENPTGRPKSGCHFPLGIYNILVYQIKMSTNLKLVVEESENLKISFSEYSSKDTD